MKTWKHCIIGILAIIALAFVLIACNDDKTDDPKCECNPKEHYLACTCPVAGTTACSCQIIPRGYVTDNAGNTIPIYQTVGVSDADAITAATNLATAYNGSKLSYRNTWNIISGKISKIMILAGDAYSFDKNTGIIELGIDWCNVDDIIDYLIYEVVPALTVIVTFDVDGGSPNPEKQYVIPGDKAIKPPEPFKVNYSVNKDYIFNYWFNVATNTEWDFNTAVTTDITLKAKWTEDW